MKRKKKKKEQQDEPQQGTPQQGEHSRRDIIISVSLILIITFIAFYPSLLNGFTNWDDQMYVTKNRTIRNLSWEGITKVFTTFHAHLYHPLVLLSYALEYHFFKLNPHAYHATNMVLHLLNCVLVFWMMFLLSRNAYGACIAAILFGVHPLRVQSVAWITERKDLLYSFFFLLSFISYIYYRGKRGVKYYYASLCFFVLSLLSKPLAATLPFILLLYDALFHEKLDRGILLAKIPFLLCSIVIVLVTFPQLTKGGSSSTIAHNIFIASYIMFSYIFEIIAPANLSFFHQYPASLKEHVPPLLLIFPPLALGLVWILIAARKYSRTVTFGGFFFLITIFPVIQIFTLAGYELIAERFTYIPSIGIMYIVSEALYFLYCRIGRNARAFLVVAVALVAGLFSCTTWQRCTILKDSPTFWNNVIAQNPEVPLAYNNRGFFYFENGEQEKALADFNKALALNPNFADAYVNRGLYYYRRGNQERAIADYTKAVTLNSNLVNVYIDRGSAFFKKGEDEKAFADFNKALAMDPDLAEAYNNRGNLYFRRGEHDRAIADYNRALKLDPNYGDAYLNRGIFYYHKGDAERAYADFDRALALDPRLNEAYNNRGNLLAGRGDFEKALADFDRALAINAKSAETYMNRGTCYYRKGDAGRALADFSMALSLDPRLVEAYNNRGSLFSRSGEYEKAFSDLNRALELNPRYAQAYLTRGNLYLRKGDYEKAAGDFTTVLKLNPTFFTILENRARAYFKMKRYAQAWDDVKKMQSNGLQPDPEFLRDLQKHSARPQ